MLEFQEVCLCTKNPRHWQNKWRNINWSCLTSQTADFTNWLPNTLFKYRTNQPNSHITHTLY